MPQGHRDQDDADRLRHDSAVAAAAKSSGGPVHGDGRDGLPSQPTLSRFVDQLSCEENLDVLKQGILSNGLRRIREECRGSEDFLVIDVDDVPFLADSHQPGSRYCCYSALVAVSGESGDILGARLRRPEEDKAGETFDFVLIVAGALEEGGGRPVMVRMDAGFPDGRTLAEFDALNIQYLARIRNNAVLNRMAEPHLDKPADLAPGEVRTVFHEHEYQAKDWDRRRRVTLVVIFSERELFPRHFWLITSLAREQVGAEELLARYRARGKAENTFGELKARCGRSCPPLHGRSTTMPARRLTGPSLLSDRSGDRRTKPFSCSPCSGINHARGSLRDGECLRERLEPRHLPRKGSARRLPCGPARKADEIPYRSVRRKLLVHPAGAAEEVHHAKRVAHTPGSRPSPTHPETGSSAEPWHPAAQTSG